MRYAFIEAQRSNYAVALLCRLLEVSEQGFYQWRKRPTARRKLEDQRLGDEVQMIHAESKQRYGSPRIWISPGATLLLDFPWSHPTFPLEPPYFSPLTRKQR